MAFGSPGCTRTERIDGAVRSTGPSRSASAGSSSAGTCVSASTWSNDAPWSIHQRNTATSACEGAGWPLGGIAFLSEVGRKIRRTIRLPAALPGTITAPDSPPLRIASGESRRSLPDCRAGPWHVTHRASSVGATSVLNTGVALGSTGPRVVLARARVRNGTAGMCSVR